MLRDPKHSPDVGDIISGGGIRRHVTGLERNPRGTVTHVTYNDTQRISISAWRAWAKIEAKVISTANP